MRRFAWVLVALLAAQPATAAPQDSAVLVIVETDAVHPELSAPVVYIDRGSGTVVAYERGKSLVLTNAHVVPDGKSRVTVAAGGKAHRATYLAGSRVKSWDNGDGTGGMRIDGPDLALLSVDAELPVAELAGANPPRGAAIRQWGYAGRSAAEGPLLKTGVVTDPDVLWGTLDQRPGDSGAGLFDESGRLVGVSHARPAAEGEVGVVAEPIATVRKFLREKAEAFPELVKRLN